MNWRSQLIDPMMLPSSLRWCDGVVREGQRSHATPLASKPPRRFAKGKGAAEATPWLLGRQHLECNQDGADDDVADDGDFVGVSPHADGSVNVGTKTPSGVSRHMSSSVVRLR